MRQAGLLLERGESVILDASWMDAVRRSEAARLAAESGSELLEFCCTCVDDVATARIDERRRRGGDVSEATTEVRAAMSERVDDWPSATVIDTSNRTPAESVSCAVNLLATPG